MSNDGKVLKINYVIRDARADDIEDIFELSALLNTINLPSNRAELEHVIDVSERSFSLIERDPTKRCFLFVLVAPDGHVIGTSQIFAKHGTLSSPHIYFQVDYDERYSETLRKYFRHRTLRLCQSFDGPTEIGSLVLDKAHRNIPEKLGQNLSYVRFLLMAMQPDFFSHRVLAELLPPLGPNFESALWDAVGRKFTGLDYYEADMISRKNKEFIKTLFPSGEIHVSLLPEGAKEVIGQVGRNSKGAAHLLSKIGFWYAHRVDPFDGGPHFEAEMCDISLVKNAKHLHAKTSSVENLVNSDFGLCARFDQQRKSGERFIACASPFAVGHHEIELPSDTMDKLSLNENDAISCVSMLGY